MAIAVITTIIAGLTATKEKDIKKIVAISTLSQLGMIIITTSIMIKYLTLLHTSTHAIFKALLFITIGRIIEKKEGSQKKKFINCTRIQNVHFINKSGNFNPNENSNNIKIFLKRPYSRTDNTKKKDNRNSYNNNNSNSNNVLLNQNNNYHKK